MAAVRLEGWKLSPTEALEDVEPRAVRALVNILYDPKRLVDRAEFRVSLADFLDLREGRFLLERLNALGVRTKRGLLALGLLFILDNEHDELIRLALGLKSDGRNWRIFGYILQDMVTADVQRVQPDYADSAAREGTWERAVYVQPRVDVLWRAMAAPVVKPGEPPIIDAVVWRAYLRSRSHF